MYSCAVSYLRMINRKLVGELNAEIIQFSLGHTDEVVHVRTKVN